MTSVRKVRTLCPPYAVVSPRAGLTTGNPSSLIHIRIANNEAKIQVRNKQTECSIMQCQQSVVT